MLGNSIVVRAHKEKLLAMITMTKSVQRFPFLSYMGVGHHLVALWAAKALTIKNATKDHMFAYHIFGAWPWYNNGSLNIMAKPMKPLELHYPVIQFLIKKTINFK